MNAYELGIEKFKEAISKKEVPYKVLPYYLNEIKKSGANVLSFMEGWNSARKEYYSKIKKTLKPSMEFVVALRLKESDYNSAYQEGYEAGQEYVKDATYDIPVLSPDELKMILDEGDFKAIELAELKSDFEEKKAFYTGFIDALQELFDEYYHDETLSEKKYEDNKYKKLFEKDSKIGKTIKKSFLSREDYIRNVNELYSALNSAKNYINTTFTANLDYLINRAEKLISPDGRAQGFEQYNIDVCLDYANMVWEDIKNLEKNFALIVEKFQLLLMEEME